MTGADIQNLVNEAALWAARHDKSRVEMVDFYYAHDKVLMGAKREEPPWKVRANFLPLNA